MIVYSATNKVNGKEYIGFTSGGLACRQKEHHQSAASGSKTAFHCALRKYGSESFMWVELGRYGTRDQALAMEMSMISARLPAYNMTAGGDGIPRGYKHANPGPRKSNWTPEGRAARCKAISDAKKGKPQPWAVGPKGIVRSEEFKRKVSLGMKRMLAEKRAER